MMVPGNWLPAQPRPAPFQPATCSGRPHAAAGQRAIPGRVPSALAQPSSRRL